MFFVYLKIVSYILTIILLVVVLLFKPASRNSKRIHRNACFENISSHLHTQEDD